jgi:hypothetical protein
MMHSVLFVSFAATSLPPLAEELDADTAIAVETDDEEEELDEDGGSLVAGTGVLRGIVSHLI